MADEATRRVCAMNDVDFEIRGEAAPFGSREYAEVMDFVHHELQLLDDGDYEPWLDLLADDLSYLMPVRITRGRGKGSGFADAGFYDDTKPMLVARVRRYLESTAGWVEDPPSRTRRFITNVRVWRDGESDRYVRANYLILRNRLDQPDYEMVSAERRDLLRTVGGSLKLLRRHVYCDQALVGAQNLAFFV
ncbi:MAG: aromatic-ring-hydroxylating dioxygenase subunit beta [Deltaproteobacteria bacterium]|nr:aromatic-ring-hydroxylating dioxygenase subunit beta [Deltaproteobacteria bacterium]MBW2500889.1 aromatic-ring-hydroxylating dioxygenase subunit beta [Deltaproteobacteria bacterium]